ncbi:bacteriocin [Siculibacillus lacustris]|uniref:Bacteriocin n=1 Tax=Siculibacillus lacustris TaxID=1549641 RepID=A0A4Q9VKL8_9HYPH|nr:YMGG-like glycine zipper-containing protein [Siculibacillus lacustris]TBW35084.1 bacteriocin [Siculibacillus lacustris]
MLKFIAPLAAVLLLAGCNSDSQSDRALGGAAIGAGTGALIGAATGNGWGGAAVGAAVGGVGGAVVGAATTPKNCIARDEYGRRVYVACP